MPFMGALSPRLAALMSVALWAWLERWFCCGVLSTAFSGLHPVQRSKPISTLTSSKRMNFALFTRVSSSSMWRWRCPCSNLLDSRFEGV